MTKIRKIKIFNEERDCQITYLIGKDVHWLKKYLRRKYGADAKYYSWGKDFKFDNTTNGYEFHVNGDLGSGEMFYVWLAEITPYLLYHETYHLAGDILYVRGVKYSYSGEETFAFLGCWIFDQVFKRMKGKLPKK